MSLATVVSVRHIPHLLDRGIVGRSTSLSEKLLRLLHGYHFVMGYLGPLVEAPSLHVLENRRSKRKENRPESINPQTEHFYTVHIFICLTQKVCEEI